MLKCKSVVYLFLVLAVTVIGVSSVTLTLLYRTALEQQGQRLSEAVQSQARLIESIARFHASELKAHLNADQTRTAGALGQIRDAQGRFAGLGTTGEFTLAERRGDRIQFLLDHRHHVHPEETHQIPFAGTLAAPMRRALSGNRGIMVGLDYRGKTVLAAYEPLAGLDWGLVAKVDLAEIRSPYLRAGLWVAAVTLGLLAVGTLLIYRITAPLTRDLEDREKRLRMVLDTAADGIITLTEEGVIESFNQAAERLFGYRAREVLGQKVDLLMPVRYRNRHENFIRRHLEASDGIRESRAISAGRILTGLRKDGSLFPMELATSEVCVGNLRRFTGIVRDITERRRAEEALCQREEQLRLTFENAPMGIYTNTLTGRFLSANRAFCRMLGYSEFELLNRNIQDVTHPDDHRGIVARTDQIVRGRLNNYSLEKRFIHKEGTPIPCVIHISVAHRADGTPRMRIVHVEDRREQIKAEAEIRAQRERLAQVSRLGALGEMATGIAHEINQPLSAIATYAQACRRLLESGERSDRELAQTLEKISTQALRAGDVIKRLRGFIKRGHLERRQVDGNALVQEVIKLAEIDAKSHLVPIDLELTDQPLPIVADSIHLQQVLLNLIRNAIEAMEALPAADRALTIRTQRHEGQVEIAVIDRGVGLAPRAAEQLFDPFFSTKTEGMGMGLSISRSIVTAHEGLLSFTPNPGGGITFYLRLPIDQGVSDARK